LALMTLILLIIIVQDVSALGITPGRRTFDYVPGQREDVSFEVINSERKEVDLVVLVQGVLNQSISVSEVSFHMNADEDRKTLSYSVTMPPGLEPGTQVSEVVVLELPSRTSNSEAFVGAAVGVATQIHVNVPYPGKFVEASFNVIGPDSGELNFVIPVVSRGDLDIARVRATIDIFSGLNEKIDTISTNEISLSSGARREVVSKWKPQNLNAGKYRAVATLIYDEETITLEKDFSIGDRLLELLQIEVNDFVLGGIAKFELLVENKWSEEILGAYAQMQVFNDEDGVMADFKSPTIDIPAFEKKLLVAFWDTVGVDKGKYKSSVFLNYGTESERQEFELEVNERSINVVGIGYVISSDSSSGGGSMTTILIVGIVILILINVLWFLVLRKRLKKK
jgi:hypothetical protein